MAQERNQPNEPQKNQPVTPTPSQSGMEKGESKQGSASQGAGQRDQRSDAGQERPAEQQ